MPGLVETIRRLSDSHSEKAKEIIQTFHTKIHELSTQTIIDYGVISRLANRIPCYFSRDELKIWEKKLIDLLENLMLHPRNIETKTLFNSIELPFSQDKKKLNNLVEAAMLSPEQACQSLQANSKGKEKINLFLDDVIREACRQLFKENGEFHDELVSLLQLDKLLDAHKDKHSEIRWGMTVTVSINLICMEILKSVRKKLDLDDGDKVFQATIAQVKPENKLLHIKYYIFLAELNEFMKNHEAMQKKVEKIINERKYLYQHVEHFITHGQVELFLKRLHDLIEDKSNLNIATIKLSIFSRKTLVPKNLHHINVRYPEFAEEIFKKIIHCAQAGRNQFVNAVQFLAMLNRYDLAYRALHPKLKMHHINNEIGQKKFSQLEIEDLQKAHKRFTQSSQEAVRLFNPNHMEPTVLHEPHEHKKVEHKKTDSPGHKRSRSH